MGEHHEEVLEAAKSLADFVSQVVYGVIAGATTVAVLHYGFDFRVHEAVEPAVLNGGIAYYTHAATGRILKALYTLAKASPLPTPRGRHSEED